MKTDTKGLSRQVHNRAGTARRKDAQGGADPAAAYRGGTAMNTSQAAPTPADPAWHEKVIQGFANQGFMALLGASLDRVEPGLVEISVPFRPDLTQQNRYFHAGVTTTLADNAGGFAAFTLFPPHTQVLTAEMKISLVAPAAGERLRALGRVVKAGRSLTTCDVEVFAERDGTARLCAKMLQTLARLDG